MLIVEDEPKGRRGLQRLLRELYPDGEVLVARHGEEALQIARQAPVDIMLADICMPIMDGIALMEKTRELGLSAEIIVLSAHREFDYVQKALKMGAMDYLLKPVAKAEVQRVFDRAIQRVCERERARNEALRIQRRLERAIPAYVNHLMTHWAMGTLPESRLREVEELICVHQCGRMVMWRIKDHAGRAPEQLDMVCNAFQAWIEALPDLRGHLQSFVPDNGGGRRIVTLLSGAEDLPAALRQTCVEWGQARGVSVVATVSDAFPCFADHIASMWSQVQRIERAWQGQGDDDGTLTRYDQIVEQVRAYVKRHLADELSMDAIAAAFHYSVPYLSRVFHGCMGITLMEYIMTMRMDRAKELLITTDQKVYEIAKQIGYADAQYFHRVFRKRVGETPESFRRTKGDARGR